MGANMNGFSHLDNQGRVRMVDVSEKESSVRIARAAGRVTMDGNTIAALRAGEIAKGNVLAVAKAAGILAAKRTAELIPLCHPLLPEHIDLEFQMEATQISIESRVKLFGRTGAEMEALTAVAVAGLTIYDMCKAMDKAMVLGDIRLIEKSGGRSGHYLREE